MAKQLVQQLKGMGAIKLKPNSYNEPIRHFIRQVSESSPDEATEFVHELETDQSLDGVTTRFTTTESTFDQQHELDETTLTTFPTYMTEVTDAVASHSDSESSNTVLIVMGILLGILVLVCCVLAFIFARIRRKGFCPVGGRNQESCDLDCPENGMSSEASPKESITLAKSVNSSSDKLLTK